MRRKLIIGGVRMLVGSLDLLFATWLGLVVGSPGWMPFIIGPITILAGW